MGDQRGLQKFLRDKRDARQPADVGLSKPTGRGRKSTGLSQWQMSELLGWKPGAYARLERTDRVATEAELHQIAEVLGLDPVQKNELWLQALGRDLGHWEPDAEANAWLDLIPALTGEAGVAAFVSDLAWNLVVCSEGYEDLFPHCPPPGNLFEWAMWKGAPFLPDHPRSWQIPLLGELDSALARQPANRKLLALLRKVRADPELRALYTARAWTSRPSYDSFPMKVGTRVGRLTMVSSTPYASPEHRIVMMRFVAEGVGSKVGGVAKHRIGQVVAA